MKHILLQLIILNLAFITISSQQFVNSDLEVANLHGGIMQLPDGWDSIPYARSYNVALGWGSASPDITTLSSPVINGNVNSIAGNPYSGNSFLYGGYRECLNNPCGFYDFLQEGIEQEVSGFSIGEVYQINFFQAVNRKNSNSYLDQGSWQTYIDDILVNTSQPSYTTSYNNGTNLVWEFRSFDFVATSNVHRIGFLSYRSPNETYLAGNVGMGIDSIYITSSSSCITSADLGNDTISCEGETINLTLNANYISYLWQDNSTSENLVVSEEGLYWVDVIDNNNCIANDSIYVSFKNCNTEETTINKNDVIILEMPNVFTPNQDQLNDVFRPVRIEGVINMKTIIFNRWGKKIYESKSLLIDWVPENQPDGVYYYTIEYMGIDNRNNNISGYFHLLK